MPLIKVTPIVSDICERKCIADQTDEDKNNPKDDYKQYLADYFEHQYGRSAFGLKQKAKFVASLGAYRETDARVRVMATCYGLERAKYCSMALTDFVFGLLRALLPKYSAIKETLDDGTHCVPLEREAAIDRIIGKGVAKKEPAAYNAPLLAAVTSDQSAWQRFIDMVDDAHQMAAAREESAPAQAAGSPKKLRNAASAGEAALTGARSTGQTRRGAPDRPRRRARARDRLVLRRRRGEHGRDRGRGHRGEVRGRRARRAQGGRQGQVRHGRRQGGERRRRFGRAREGGHAARRRRAREQRRRRPPRCRERARRRVPPTRHLCETVRMRKAAGRRHPVSAFRGDRGRGGATLATRPR